MAGKQVVRKDATLYQKNLYQVDLDSRLVFYPIYINPFPSTLNPLSSTRHSSMSTLIYFKAFSLNIQVPKSIPELFIRLSNTFIYFRASYSIIEHFNLFQSFFLNP